MTSSPLSPVYLCRTVIADTPLNSRTAHRRTPTATRKPIRSKTKRAHPRDAHGRLSFFLYP